MPSARQPSRPRLFEGRKFGIEIEVANISQRTLCDALLRANISCAAEAYNHRTRNHWKATTDSSIRSDNGQACELVSPILSPTPETFEQIKTILRVIEEQGGIVNDSCGFHVHVDCRGVIDPDFWRLMLSFYSMNEEKIDSLVTETRRGNENRYCQTNKLYDNDAWTRLWQTDLEMSSSRLSNYLGGQDRYRKLNFASFVRHGTVEFRQFHGTLDFGEMKSWIGFCLNLVNTVYRTTQTPNLKTKLRGNQEIVNVPLAPTKTFEAMVVAYAQRAFDNYQHYSPWPARRTRNIMIGERPTNLSDSTRMISDVFTQMENRAPRFFKMQNYEKALIQKMALLLVQHLAVSVGMYSLDVRNNIINDNTMFRDGDFWYSSQEEMTKSNIQFAAYLFGFYGSEAEVSRKVKSKLRNIGVALRDGMFTVLDSEESFELSNVITAVCHSSGTSPGWNDRVSTTWESNRFYRFFKRRTPRTETYSQGESYGTVRAIRRDAQDRLPDSSTLNYLEGRLIANRAMNFHQAFRSFPGKAAKFWCSNPRNLERPYNGTNSFNALILCFLTQAKSAIHCWTADYDTSVDSLEHAYFNVRYEPNAVNYGRESQNFRNNEWNGNSANSFRSFFEEYNYQYNVIDYPTFSPLLQENQPSNFPTLSREPYFEVVKEIAEVGDVALSLDEVSNARKEYLAMLDKLRLEKERERQAIRDGMASRQRRNANARALAQAFVVDVDIPVPEPVGPFRPMPVAPLTRAERQAQREQSRLRQMISEFEIIESNERNRF